MSERHACRVVGQWRTTQRYQPTQCDDEDRLTQSILALASQYGRFGYRRITALLKTAGWIVGKDRVQRIWRREGLKVPAKHRPRGRLPVRHQFETHTLLDECSGIVKWPMMATQFLPFDIDRHLLSLPLQEFRGFVAVGCYEVAVQLLRKRLHFRIPP